MARKKRQEKRTSLNMRKENEQMETNTQTEARQADFECLSPEVKQSVTRGLFGVGSDWAFLSEIMRADPGRRLAMSRVVQKLSQQEVAEQANIRQADVSNAESNIDQVKLNTIRKIARVLGIPVKELVRNDNDNEERS